MEDIINKIAREIDELIKVINDSMNKEYIVIDNIQLKTQINYLKTDLQPKNVINIIKTFNNALEKEFTSFNKILREKYTYVNDEHFSIIKQNIIALQSSDNNLNIAFQNINNNIIIQKQKPVIPFKKIIKEYEKINMLLISKIRYSFDIIIFLFDNLEIITSSIKNIIKEYEQIGNKLANKKEDDPIINDCLIQICNFYVKIVELFNKIDSFFEKVKIEEDNLNKRNALKKLEKLNNNINENGEIKQKIKEYIIETNSIYSKIINILNQFQNYKIHLDFLGKNEMRLDILIILDTTNSMGKYLKLIQNKIKFIKEEIKKKCPLAIIYVGFIGYKDFSDLELGDEYTDIDFTSDIDELYNKIKDIEADGGDDIPEDVAGAFQLALKKNWGIGSKLAFLITDSPCHGTEYHDLDQKNKNYIDKFPEEDYKSDKTDMIEESIFKRKKMKELVRDFAKKDISLVCFDILELTQKMFNIFNDIYKEENKSEFYYIEKGKLDEIIIKKAIDIYKMKEETIRNIFQIKKDMII